MKKKAKLKKTNKNNVRKVKDVYGDTKTALKKTFRSVLRETRNVFGFESVGKDVNDKIKNVKDEVKNA